MQVKVDHGGCGWQIVRFVHFICSFFHECCSVGRCKGFDFLLAMSCFFTWKDSLPEQEYHVYAFTAKLHLTCLKLNSEYHVFIWLRIRVILLSFMGILLYFVF